ncbi:hypothetical protein LDG_9082 [Legionella drancourtii LLAP12]|uniref:Uncharacterized protein n=1 Tax=Legionella drancourtii LLAP12 TaxID=658187 RepID=G9EUT2_9GAMM|nr:hypothetical protein LDG_9082 [Legionella drancourtii LLAP12]
MRIGAAGVTSGLLDTVGDGLSKSAVGRGRSSVSVGLAKVLVD